MDELLSPCSTFSPPSFFSHAGGHPIIEFDSCDVPEQWLLGDVAAKNEGYADDGEELWPLGAGSFSPDSELSVQPPPPATEQKETEPSAATAPAQRPPGKRRGRKPGPRPEGGPTVSHVEAERQRREKLNRRFCDLRAAVPTVSRMDKASLLADAAAYIAELRGRVARLEAEARQRAAAARWEPPVAAAAAPSSSGGAAAGEEALEVRMLGPDAAAVRATSSAPHAPARLMGALRALELRVQHACVSRVHGVTVQDVVVDVPAAVQDDDGLRAALLEMLMLQDSSS
ncbi:hypothetical protein ACP4OV_024205 [Aristida adscensionis]